MRHFLAERAPGAIPGLPRGMAKPPRPTVLIAAAGGVERRELGPPRARPRAVAIAPITVPAEKEHATAITASADHEPKGIQASPRAAHGGGQSQGGVRR